MSDGSGIGDADYDSAAQANMAIAATTLGIQFAQEAKHIAETYWRDRLVEQSDRDLLKEIRDLADEAWSSCVEATNANADGAQHFFNGRYQALHDVMRLLHTETQGEER